MATIPTSGQLPDIVQREIDLTEDARWHLIERILATGPFQKSERLRELLQYVVKQTLNGHGHDLTEHNIGVAVYGKPGNYSPVEDSSVRVHARQLRLKLHEYFDGEGRDESTIIEIPKGSYVPVFHAARQVSIESTPSLSATSPPVRRHQAISRSLSRALPWSIAIVLAIVCAFLGVRLQESPPPPARPPWPLSAVFNGVDRTKIVLSDANYGMLRIVSEQAGSLEEYLSPDMQQKMTPAHLTDRESRIMQYIKDSDLTSYAGTLVATNLVKLAPKARSLVSVVSARDLRMPDLQHGNFVFIGSPSSNPWVSLYQDKLNFKEEEGVVGDSMKYFANLHPRTGERQKYQGLKFTGAAGEDYATISLLPTASGNGSVLILQGLHQEGTEAAGLFITNKDSRAKLLKALGLQAPPTKPIYFDVLIRTQAVAGESDATSIVAVRRIP